MYLHPIQCLQTIYNSVNIYHPLHLNYGMDGCYKWKTGPIQLLFQVTNLTFQYYLGTLFYTTVSFVCYNYHQTILPHSLVQQIDNTL
jgi:hypothetical protein